MPELTDAWLNLADGTVARAREGLRLRRVHALAAAGPIASGKNTVAGLFMNQIAGHHTQLAFADAVKADVNRALAHIGTAQRHSESPEQAQDRILADPTLTLADSELSVQRAASVTDALWQEAAAIPDLDTRTHRTDGSRRAHQEWGRITRLHDPWHWVRITLADLAQALAEGRSVAVTDARMLNEMQALHSLGVPVVLVTVTRETQLARLASRQDQATDLTALNHPSERELSQYDQYDAVVSNDGTVHDTVQALAAALDGGRRRVQARTLSQQNTAGQTQASCGYAPSPS